MKKTKIKTYSIEDLKKMKSNTNLKKILKINDNNINFDDDSLLANSAWNNAEIIYPESKSATLSIRIKPTIKMWYKNNHKNYQTLIHEILESFMRKQSG